MEISLDPSVEIHPTVLKAIVDQYHELAALVVLTPKFLKELNAKLSRFYPPVETEEDVKILLLSLPKYLACSECKERAKGMCAQCAAKERRAVDAKRIAVEEPEIVDVEERPIVIDPFPSLPADVQERFDSEGDQSAYERAQVRLKLDPPSEVLTHPNQAKLAEVARRNAARLRLNNFTNVPAAHEHLPSKTGTEE